MTAQKINKTPLNLDSYETFGIPQEYMAFDIKVENIDQESFDNLEAEYQGQGYKIFNSEMEREAVGNGFRCRIIVAKMGFTY